MKVQALIRPCRAFALLTILCAASWPALGQGTLFTYQGQLLDNASPANGTNYGMLFTVYNDPTNGTGQGSLGIVSVTVSNGLFTVPLDFGNIFDGSPRWLEIKVQKNGGGFTTLNPRQRIAPSPYAIFSGSASNLTGTIPAAQINGTLQPGQLGGAYSGAVTFSNAANSFTGAFSGNGANLTGVDATTLSGFGSFDFWQLGGNNVGSGQFLGSTNNRSVEIRVNNLKAMQFSYASNSSSGYSPNIIGGISGNTAAAGVAGAVIGGGGSKGSTNAVTGDFGVVGGGWNNAAGRISVVGGGVNNWATNESATIGGGILNVASGAGSTVGGGGTDGTISFGNTASGKASTVSGGNGNYATNANATVAGGAGNTAYGAASTVSGGFDNSANGTDAAIPGGYFNIANGDYSFAAGWGAGAMHNGTFVWSDPVYTGANFNSTSSNQFLIKANGGVGIGTNHPGAALHVVSSSSSPEVQITQQNSSDYTRLRMNVAGWPGSPFWELDVTPAAQPSLQFWNSTLRMTIDYNGNVSATSFNPTSDRNAKENFEPIDPREVLNKVNQLPLTRWNYKSDAAKHVGPMAQDFYAAFNVGLDDKHIATVDADGVALAAIQGLNNKVDERVRNLERENAELKDRLERLERLLAGKHE